jgi:hypothetical protein
MLYADFREFLFYVVRCIRARERAGALTAAPVRYALRLGVAVAVGQEAAAAGGGNV